MSGKILIKTVAQTGKTPTGVIIFLHGSGDTGRGVHDWITQLVPGFSFPYLKILFPTAPLRPYTPLQGAMSNVWFDRLQISKQAPEDLSSIDFMAKEIESIIKKEVEGGIPLNRIVVGGFSMGGAMAMHMGYRHVRGLAGVFAISSFINDGSAVWLNLKDSAGPKPPLFQWHGERDNLVPLAWGDETFKSLQKLGVQGEFHTNKNALHELKKDVLAKLTNWIKTVLPDS